MQPVNAKESMPSKSGTDLQPRLSPKCYHTPLLSLYNIRSKLAWVASTLGVVTLGFSMFALVATAKGDEKFQKEVKLYTTP